MDNNWKPPGPPPPPWGSNRTMVPPPPLPPPPRFPLEGSGPVVSGLLSEPEVKLIIESTLLPEHREDPNVLLFIASYLRCRDTRQAAREAGLDVRSGPNLRLRPDIHTCITALSEKSVLKYGFDASEVVEKVKEVMNFDPIELEHMDGTFKEHLRDIAPEARRAIKRFKAKNFYETDVNGMKVLAGKIIEVEFYDKMKAIELSGREKKLFKETKSVEHDVSNNMRDLLLASTQRADNRILEIEARSVDEGDT